MGFVISDQVQFTETFAHRATIFVGGSYDKALEICRKYCNESPCCVNVSNADFVYSGGMEAGVRVEFINYARFPCQLDENRKKAFALAHLLIVGLHQSSATVIDDEKSTFISRRADEQTSKDGLEKLCALVIERDAIGDSILKWQKMLPRRGAAISSEHIEELCLRRSIIESEVLSIVDVFSHEAGTMIRRRAALKQEILELNKQVRTANIDTIAKLLGDISTKSAEAAQLKCQLNKWYQMVAINKDTAAL